MAEADKDPGHVPDLDDAELFKQFGNLCDEDLLLFTIAKEKDGNAGSRIGHGPKFNLDDFTDVITNFRFTRDDIHKLCSLLQFPEKVTSTSRVTSIGLECLCIMLRCLAYPNRLEDLDNIFGGRHQSEISVLCTYAVQHVYNTHRHVLLNINQTWIVDNIPLFAEAITNAGSSLTNCWGFVDGTVHPICRPTNNQWEVFNGHKRVHALKFQSVMAPNRLIADLAVPFEASLLRESQLLERIEAVPELRYYCLYGDPAYQLRTTLINPFSGPHLTPDQEHFNKAMASVRQCVEWGFGKVLRYFGFLDFKKNLKL